MTTVRQEVERAECTDDQLFWSEYLALRASLAAEGRVTAGRRNHSVARCFRLAALTETSSPVIGRVAPNLSVARLWVGLSTLDERRRDRLLGLRGSARAIGVETGPTDETTRLEQVLAALEQLGRPRFSWELALRRDLGRRLGEARRKQRILRASGAAGVPRGHDLSEERQLRAMWWLPVDNTLRRLGLEELGIAELVLQSDSDFVHPPCPAFVACAHERGLIWLLDELRNIRATDRQILRRSGGRVTAYHRPPRR